MRFSPLRKRLVINVPRHAGMLHAVDRFPDDAKAQLAQQTASRRGTASPNLSLTLDDLLSSAASFGLEAIVKILLEKRRNTSTQTSKELSALCLAAYNGHKTVVKQLLESNHLDLRLPPPNHPSAVDYEWLTQSLRPSDPNS